VGPDSDYIRPVNAQLGNSQLTFDSADLIEVDRPDNIDNRQLTLFGHKNSESGQTVALRHEKYVRSLLIAQAVHTDNPDPAGRCQLTSNRFDVRRRVGSVAVELVASHIDSPQSRNQASDPSKILILGNELQSKLEKRAIECHIHRLSSLLCERVEM